MDHFNYQGGELHCESVPISAIVERTGTPVYIYSTATFTEHYRRLSKAFAPLDPLICYAVKSCSNLAILRLLADLGAGMDVVSGGELHRVRRVGVRGAKIVFAGVGKTDREIRDALSYTAIGQEMRGIGLFNIESEAEFDNISAIAKSLGRTCQATLRINPDVDPHTHQYTTTGKKETKFGVDLDRAREFFRTRGHDEHCRLAALHLHIGSPVCSVAPFVEAVERALRLIDDLTDEGFAITVLNIGGGFGADYETDQSPSAADYAEALIPLLANRVAGGLKIILEPGRSIAANGGILVTRVQYLKQSGHKRFVIVDGGMNVLIRPALYGAFHFVWPVKVAPMHVPVQRRADMEMPGLETCDVVGPICESGDFLALDRKLPRIARGELLAVFGAGAYGSVMASRYNSMPLPPEVLVDGAHAQLIRRAESYDDLISHEDCAEQLTLLDAIEG